MVEAANFVLEILQRLKSARQPIVQVNFSVLVGDGLPSAKWMNFRKKFKRGGAVICNPKKTVADFFQCLKGGAGPFQVKIIPLQIDVTYLRTIRNKLFWM